MSTEAPDPSEVTNEQLSGELVALAQAHPDAKLEATIDGGDPAQDGHGGRTIRIENLTVAYHMKNRELQHALVRELTLLADRSGASVTVRPTSSPTPKERAGVPGQNGFYQEHFFVLEDDGTLRRAPGAGLRPLEKRVPPSRQRSPGKAAPAKAAGKSATGSQSGAKAAAKKAATRAAPGRPTAGRAATPTEQPAAELAAPTGQPATDRAAPTPEPAAAQPRAPRRERDPVERLTKGLTEAESLWVALRASSLGVETAKMSDEELVAQLETARERREHAKPMSDVVKAWRSWNGSRRRAIDDEIAKREARKAMGEAAKDLPLKPSVEDLLPRDKKLLGGRGVAEALVAQAVKIRQHELSKKTDDQLRKALEKVADKVPPIGDHYGEWAAQEAAAEREIATRKYERAVIAETNRGGQAKPATGRTFVPWQQLTAEYEPKFGKQRWYTIFHHTRAQCFRIEHPDVICKGHDAKAIVLDERSLEVLREELGKRLEAMDVGASPKHADAAMGLMARVLAADAELGRHRQLSQQAAKAQQVVQRVELDQGAARQQVPDQRSRQTAPDSEVSAYEAA